MMAEQFWFEWLPDDIIRMIMDEWIGHVKDIVSLDNALCNRNFRTNRFAESFCERQIRNKVNINLQNFDLQRFIVWEISRGVHFTNLHLKCTSGEILKFQSLKHAETLTIDFVHKGYEWVIDIADLLNSLPVLKCFSMTGVNSDSLQLFHRNFLFESLRTISFFRVALPERVEDIFVDNLIYCCPNLEEICFRYCRGMNSFLLIKLLKELRNLHKIDFRAPSTYAMARFIVQGQLTSSPITAEEKSKILEHFHTCSTNADDSFVASFQRPNITTLHLDLFNDWETFYLLHHCPAVNRLSVNMQDIVKEELVPIYLQHILPLWSHLQSLTFALHSTSLEPVEDIYQDIISTCLQMKSLNIYSTQELFHSTAFASQSVMHSLRIHWKLLQSLRCERLPQLTDDAIGMICDMNDSLPALQSIHMIDCPCLSTVAYEQILSCYATQCKELTFIPSETYSSSVFRLIICNTSLSKVKKLIVGCATMTAEETSEAVEISKAEKTMMNSAQHVTFHSLLLTYPTMLTLLTLFPSLLTFNCPKLLLINKTNKASARQFPSDLHFQDSDHIRAFQEFLSLSIPPNY
jgi:hypothetical protein